MNKKHPLIIIGGGPAGLTTAIYSARARLNPLLFEGKEPGGQLMGTTYVENWPGSKKILGPQLMMDMRAHAIEQQATILTEMVTNITPHQENFIITSATGTQYETKAVVIATGARPKKLGCPGENEYWGKGVTTCAVCDGAFYPQKRVVIVGGGDTAMEDASFMTRFTNDITIVHIGSVLTASSAMQERVLQHPHIKIIYESTVTAIDGDGHHVTAVHITHLPTNKTVTMSADAIFIAIGLSPQSDLIKSHVACHPNGYIKTTGTKTSFPGIFAAGDVVDYKYRQAITSAGMGCQAALDVETYLRDRPKNGTTIL